MIEGRTKITTIRIAPDENPTIRNPVRTAGDCGLEHVSCCTDADEDIITKCFSATGWESHGIHADEYGFTKWTLRRRPGVEHVWMQRR